MHRGYIKLWRKSEESPIARAPYLIYRLWNHILCRSNWKEKLMNTRNGFGIWVSPGTLITSMDSLSEGIACEERGAEKRPNRKTIMVALRWMEDQGMISVESNRFGTAIFVMNWQTYQQTEGAEVTPTGQPTGQPKQHQLDTTKEVKEVKRRKRKENILPGCDLTKPEKGKYGDQGLVLLTDEEVEKLKARFGEDKAAGYIEDLDLYIGSKGVKYTSHYFTILSWNKKDQKR